MLIQNPKALHFQRIDKPIKLSPGLKKILSTKSQQMSRFELMDRLIEKLHFYKMHNVLTSKNFKLPPQWQKILHTSLEFVDELDLLEIVSQNNPVKIS
jgi:hypothetical protein